MARNQLDLTNENVSPIKIILLLSWPLFLEQILSTFVSFADTAMVGALGNPGKANRLLFIAHREEILKQS